MYDNFPDDAKYIIAHSQKHACQKSAAKKEELLIHILLSLIHISSAAQELGRGILERVLTYSGYCATDDMTVLAAGLWRN